MALVERILSRPYDDGFSFVDIAVHEMSHPHMNYPGFEVTTIACLGQTRTTIRMDLGIGDIVVAERKAISLLALDERPLFESEISLQVYPPSYIFAEKLEAIVYRGGINSRMKDFYDLIALFKFPGLDLKASKNVIRSVFEHRQTSLPTRLSYDLQAMETLSRSWKRFHNTLENEFQQKAPADFLDVIARIDQMLALL